MTFVFSFLSPVFIQRSVRTDRLLGAQCPAQCCELNCIVVDAAITCSQLHGLLLRSVLANQVSVGRKEVTRICSNKSVS